MRTLLIIFFAILLFGYSAQNKVIKEGKGSLENIANSANDSMVPDTGDLVCLIGYETIDANINHKIWTDYLNNNLVLDEASIETIPPGKYTVFVQFMIDEEGKIGNVSLLKDAGFGLGKKAMKAVADYKGLWEPAKLYDRAIKSYRRQPITFVIEEEEKKECKNELPAELIL